MTPEPTNKNLVKRIEELEKIIRKQKQENDVLSKNEGIFRLMVLEVKDYAIFMLNTQGDIISWNEGAQNIKGYSSEEIIGKHFSCFYLNKEKRINKPGKELETAKEKSGPRPLFSLRIMSFAVISSIFNLL